MAQTLFQRLMYGKEVTEFKYFNPILAKIGNKFTIDYIGFRDIFYELKEIVEYTRKNLKFCDYVLSSGDNTTRLRLFPNTKSYDVIVLTKYDEMRFSKDLDAAVRDVSGEFIITMGENEERYFRPQTLGERLKEPHQVVTKVISDVNNDGEVEENEVYLVKMEYWDFARITNDEAGQEFTQHLFVEVNLKTGIQTMWRGEEIDLNKVNLL